MKNLTDTVISQYANSPTLLSLIETFNEVVEPAGNIDDFYNFIWNILTAEGYGLIVWGRIVGVTNVLTVAGGEYLGFEESDDATIQPFGQAPFWSGTPASSNYVLSDDAFRALILTKALANISRSSIQIYNQMLMQLFPNRGNAFVTDTGDMNARLTFEFILQPFEVAILKQSGAFAPPTGVAFEIMDIDIGSTFGFAESGDAEGWNNGVFFAGYE